jgi:23S rRNA (guanine745-N1)-methyltransferase
MVCPRGHSFDVARSGYVNLLQPNEKRSKAPGDAKEIVAARRRFFDRGIERPLIEAVVGMLDAAREVSILDAGCGEGSYLDAIARELGGDAHGVDISIPAVDAAARRYNAHEWIVANADRFIPYADASFGIVLSITARMNAAEFRRVIRDDGLLLVAIPAPGDVTTDRDRVRRTIDTFAAAFELVEHRRLATEADLDEDAVRDLLASSYRGYRARSFESRRVTLARDALLFRPMDLRV